MGVKYSLTYDSSLPLYLVYLLTYYFVRLGVGLRAD